MTKMTKTQKKLLMAAAMAGLVAGTIASAKNVSNDQIQNMAGKQALGNTTSLNGCPGCPAKTNSVSTN
jgi:uncharacterized protein (DUF2345 family)